MNSLIVESERLRLREFTVADTDFILQLVNSEGWIKYIGDRNIKTQQQAVDYLNNGPIKSYLANGFGLCMVELRGSKTPIGMCGLLRRDYLPHLDLGFAFLPSYTRKGYAHEIATETLKFAFDHLKQESVLAITLPTNLSSIKLLKKLGMNYSRKLPSSDSGEELLVYEINKDDRQSNAV
jgi:RimJ/RimL family protein N-acetyltransferase